MKRKYMTPLTTCEQIDVRLSVMAGSPPSILSGGADSSEQYGKDRDVESWEEM